MILAPRTMRMLFIFLAVLSAPVWAQAPNSLTYQGRLKDSGTPVTGARSVEVLLCPGLSGGGCTGTGAQNISVASGLFRTTFTVPSGVDLTSGQWYLEINVGGTALSPREPLTAAPYAVFASSAGTLTASSGAGGVGIATSVFLTAGRLGVGTASPASILHVNGPITYKTRNVVSDDTIAEGDSVIFADASAGTIVLTLPSCGASSIGRVYQIYKTDSSANAVIVAAFGGEAVIGDPNTGSQGGMLWVIAQSVGQWISAEP